VRKGKGVGGAEESEGELVNERKIKIEKSREKSKESTRKYPRGKKENILLRTNWSSAGPSKVPGGTSPAEK
jgi:hypothetical protein